ncbi:MAG TPA: hypothetical protein VNS09_09900 [Solirubrobacter sp.]|nr:hypothetical protein [Solirubrobacter sp.]
MEVAAVLRTLWSRRLLCLPGIVLALAATFHYASKPAQLGGFAATRILLDTNPSQLVKPLPAGAESLGWRAQLLAEIMTDDATRDLIARDLNVRPKTVRVLEPSLQAPITPTAIARTASGADGLPPAYLIATVAADQNLGTLDIGAYAPDRDGARKLALAVADAVTANSAQSVKVGAGAPTPTPRPNPDAAPTPTPVPPSYGLGAPRDTSTIQGYKVLVSPVAARTEQISSSKGKGVLAGVAILVIWAAAVLVLPGLLRGLRAGRRRLGPVS